MDASVVSISSFNDQFNNIQIDWDDWYQNSPNFSKSLVAPTTPFLFEHNLSLDPTLCSLISSAAFVNPECLQLNSVAPVSASPINSHSDDDDTFSPIPKNKRRKAGSVLRPTTPLNLEVQSSTKRSFYATANPKQHYNAPREASCRTSATELVRKGRNRNAAAKCRAKYKAAEEVLKDKQRIERERNRLLRGSFEGLKNEILMLKNELFRHSACNHPIIDNYFRRSADQISEGIRNLLPLTKPALNQGGR